MIKIKTQDLTGAALDWAVAKCEWDVLSALNIQYPQYAAHFPKISPSTDWAQGGPIIERENICLRGVVGGFHAWYHQMPPKMFGTSMLIAAMRCYVASKLGDEIEIPEELHP